MTLIKVGEEDRGKLPASVAARGEMEETTTWNRFDTPPHWWQSVAVPPRPQMVYYREYNLRQRLQEGTEPLNYQRFWQAN